MNWFTDMQQQSESDMTVMDWLDCLCPHIRLGGTPTVDEIRHVIRHHVLQPLLDRLDARHDDLLDCVSPHETDPNRQMLDSDLCCLREIIEQVDDEITWLATYSEPVCKAIRMCSFSLFDYVFQSSEPPHPFAPMFLTMFVDRSLSPHRGPMFFGLFEDILKWKNWVPIHPLKIQNTLAYELRPRTAQRLQLLDQKHVSIGDTRVGVDCYDLCAVCMAPFSAAPVLAQSFSCRHRLHFRCARRMWDARPDLKFACPVCRSPP